MAWGSAIAAVLMLEQEDDDDEQYLELCILSVMQQDHDGIRVRHHMTRKALLPPHLSPWRRLLHSQCDRSLITTTGFSFAAFSALLVHFEPHFESCYRLYVPLPKRHSNPRHLNTCDVLGLALTYLNSTMRQKTLSMQFGLTPSSLSRYLWSGMLALRMSLGDCEAAAVEWPTIDEMTEYSAITNLRELLVNNVFGFVDGLNLKVQEPHDSLLQNSHYNGWLSGTFVSMVAVFDPLGCIRWARYNCPGSWHDAWIAHPLRELMCDQQKTPSPFAIVADTAFPRTKDLLGRIITPLKDDELGSFSLQDLPARLAMSRSVTSLRQAAEWGMRGLQGPFARLTIPLPTDAAKRERILCTVLHLHNLRARWVGLNQIQTVYSPLWTPPVGRTKDTMIRDVYARFIL